MTPREALKLARGLDRDSVLDAIAYLALLAEEVLTNEEPAE